MTSEAALPPLYACWLHAITGGAIPAEAKATCDNCAMLPSDGGSLAATYFHPITKCCAFQPHLPNFLAGLILSDFDPSMIEGRKELEQRISRKVAISPRWAGPGAVFSLLYRNTPEVFGRAPELRCHFLGPNGECRVWKYRPGVCATWFCKHVRGATGFRFWRIADKLLRQVEHDLSLWCLAELKTGSAEVELDLGSAPHVSELGGEVDWQQYRELWGDWAGREMDFYRASAQLVAPLAWEQVERVCGPRVRILAGLLRDAFIHLTSEAIPERLRLGAFRWAGSEGRGYKIEAYSTYDPLFIPEQLARVLHYFDGRNTDEALAAIAQQEGVHIEVSLVRKMVDFGILEGCLEKGSLPVVG